MTSVTSDRRQGLNSSAAIKVPCRVGTTANIVLSGLQTVDGVVLASGDRVLVKDQTTQTDNGIYAADTGTWTRDLDFDGAYDAVQGTLVTANEGNTNAGTAWRLTTTPSAIGTSAIAFTPALFSSLAGYSFTQSGSGAVPRTAQSKMRDIVSVLDNGVVPNDNTKAAANLAALLNLVATSANGGDAAMQFTGGVWFPPVAGGRATYYIGGILPMRDGINVDLGGNVAYFTKAESTLEDQAGFFYACRDFTLENGYITVDYITSVAGRGNAVKLGARPRDTDQGAGQYFLNNAEEDQQPATVAGAFVTGQYYTIDSIGSTNFTLIGAASNTVGLQFQATGPGTGTGTAGAVMPYMPGNIRIANLRIKSNNANTPMIQMLGGLKGVTFDGVYLDGQNLAYSGIDYEYGNAAYNGDPAPYSVPSLWSSSHGNNFYFHNVEVKNLLGIGTDGTAISIRGAYNVTIDGFVGSDVQNLISFSPGEAENYRPGYADIAGVKRNNYLRNIVGQRITVTGIVLAGDGAWTGYLSPLAIQTQTNVENATNELLDVIVENFTLQAATINTGSGFSTSGGKITLRNGRVQGFALGMFESGTKNLSMDNVDILDNAGTGIRCLAGYVYKTGWTDRQFYIRGGSIAGNNANGILFESGQVNAVIDSVKFGYNQRATAQITVNDNNAAHTMTALAINGVDCLGGTITWTTSNTATAAAIAAQINTYASAPDYSAASQGATVLIRALSGTGTGPNGFVIAPTGNMVTTRLKNMSGGKIELTQTGSVFVSAGLLNITVRNCNTRAVAAGGTSYQNQNTASSNGCNLVKNIGDTSQSGPWDMDGIGQATATHIADKTDTINTVGKYASRLAWDTSNARLMVAVGSTATSNWKTADGGTTVTPA